MRIVGICGSPRKGNTEWMLSKLLESVEDAGVSTELILLREKNIKACDGCLACEAGAKSRKGFCHIKDDMSEIYPKLLGADALALGTPVYFGMLSGLLKNFMDRTCPIWRKLESKPIVGVAVAEEGIEKAVDNLKTYSSICSMRWVGYVSTLAKKPRQVDRDKDAELRLKRLGSKLAKVVLQ